MSQNNGLPPIPKTALSEGKLKVQGPKVEGAQFASSLRIGFVGNQPRFEVVTGVQKDNKQLVLRARMDTDNFHMVLTALEDLALTGENGERMGVTNKAGKPREMRNDSKIMVGKSNDGVIWLSVLSADPNDPKIQIQLLPSMYHDWVDKEGNALDKARASALFVRSYVNRTRLILSSVQDTHYQEPQPYQGGGNRGGGGGNYNRGGNNGGGNNYNRGNQGGGNNYNNGGGGNQNSGGGNGGYNGQSASNSMDDFGDELPL